MLERTANLLQYCLQLTLFIVSGSPSNTMLCGGDQNTMLGIETRESCRFDAVSLPATFIVSDTPSNKDGVSETIKIAGSETASNLQDSLVSNKDGVSNKICGGDQNTIHGMESPVWHMLLCRKLFCLWLPILYHAGGRLAKYNDWNVKSCEVDASMQQTPFIVSPSPFNTMC